MSLGPIRPPLLGELETAVMGHLWTAGEGDPKSVHAALGKRRGIGVNTVQSTLKRLFEKGLLDREKISHAHVYRPRVTREEFHGELLRCCRGSGGFMRRIGLSMGSLSRWNGCGSLREHWTKPRRHGAGGIRATNRQIVAASWQAAARRRFPVHSRA